MIKLTDLPVQRKVYAYILREGCIKRQLLVFTHVDLPEAGIQVPGGSVEIGEEYKFAAEREVEEETGLKDLLCERKLGEVRRDLRGFGLHEVHHRHYFQFSCLNCDKDEWIGFEETPSDGSQGPIAFKFFWVDLDSVPVLRAGLDEMLSSLI